MSIMEEINIEVISSEIIKPLPKISLEEHDHFKICLLDKITPTTYLPFIFFYPSHVAQDSSENENTRPFSTHLKTSLSEALTRFYPFSGRLKEGNLFVHDLHKGVPFKESRVTNSRMLDFLGNPTLIMSSLNRFLPSGPFCNEISNTDMSQVAVQLTYFSCGGIAIGVCISHKIADTTTCATFLKSWATITRGEQIAASDDLDLSGASLRFPGVDSLPQFYTSSYENIWFGEGNFKTERFVFDEEALAALKARARSELVPNPSRVQALSTFIWKCAMDGSSSSPKTRVMAQAVNIRPRQVPSTKTSTCRGNLFWTAIAIYNDDCATIDGKAELTSLVELVSESVSKVNNDYMRTIRGDEAFDLVTGQLRMIEEIYSYEEPEVMGFTSWLNMGLKDFNFGSGKPIWVGVFGEAGPKFKNLVVLNDATWCSGIEAWVNLDEKMLDMLKNDPEFLALVSINPSIPV